MRHVVRSVSGSLQETAHHHHFFRENLYYNRHRPIFFRAANLPAGFSRTAVPRSESIPITCHGLLRIEELLDLDLNNGCC